MDELMADKALGAKLKAPSISHGSQNLYMRGPLEEATRDNLAKVTRCSSHITPVFKDALTCSCCRAHDCVDEACTAAHFWTMRMHGGRSIRVKPRASA